MFLYNLQFSAHSLCTQCPNKCSLNFMFDISCIINTYRCRTLTNMYERNIIIRRTIYNRSLSMSMKHDRYIIIVLLVRVYYTLLLLCPSYEYMIITCILICVYIHIHIYSLGQHAICSGELENDILVAVATGAAEGARRNKNKKERMEAQTRMNVKSNCLSKRINSDFTRNGVRWRLTRSVYIIRP